MYLQNAQFIKNLAAVAQEVELVVHQPEGERYDLSLPQLPCRSVLEQDTAPQIAPDGCASSAWVMFDRKGAAH